MSLKMSRLTGAAMLALAGGVLALYSLDARAEDTGSQLRSKPPSATEAPAAVEKAAPDLAPDDRVKAQPAPKSEGCPFDGPRKLELIV